MSQISETGEMDDDDRFRSLKSLKFAAEHQLDDLPPQSKITVRFSEIEPHDIDAPAEKGLPRKRLERSGGRTRSLDPQPFFTWRKNLQLISPGLDFT
jgi:hypothetical protein